MRIYLIVILVILTAGRARSQSVEPLELAKLVFSRDSIPGLEQYIGAGYQGLKGGDLRDGVTSSCTLLEQKEHKAVVAVTILDSGGKGFDGYLYFAKDKIWRLNEFRALAMTGIIQQAKEELEAMTKDQVNDLIQRSASDKEHADLRSWEDYEFELGNMSLTLELDEHIIRHFLDHQPEFERIRDMALKQLDTVKTDDMRSTNLVEYLKQDYRKLFISGVSCGYELNEHCINFLIGGMVDNNVGYLYVKEATHVPEMDAGRIIMIRAIGNGWYLYKTT